MVHVKAHHVSSYTRKLPHSNKKVRVKAHHVKAHKR